MRKNVVAAKEPLRPCRPGDCLIEALWAGEWRGYHKREEKSRNKETSRICRLLLSLLRPC